MLALVWGYLRGIPWWSRFALDRGVIFASAAGVLVAGLGWLLSQRRPEVETLAWVFGDIPMWILAGLALLSGVAEEALFRGVLCEEIGVLPSSVIFGLLHAAPGQGPLASIWSFAVGLGLGAFYSWSGNLLPCVAFHSCSNCVSFHMLRRFRGSK